MTEVWITAGKCHKTVTKNDELPDLNCIDDDSIDPRVQEELERLNNATDAINKLEVELDEARAVFRQLLSESSQKINGCAKKLGSCIEKARPYYEARMKAKESHSESQKAALRFERANGAHAAAKEMVFLAEEGLQKEGRTFDPAWQEMLNHATMRVNEAERERTLSEQEHRKTSNAYNDIDRLVKELKNDLKKSISKSRPYFEMKAQFNKMMEEQKRRVQELEENVLKSKLNYADALHNLEEISDEIHQKRKLQKERNILGMRESGVGAEYPEPTNKIKITSDASNKNGHFETREFLELPIKLRFPKSLSSSTLSQMDAEQTNEGKISRYSSRLRKSNSVVDRSEVSTLFGRFSISRNNRLQVDHASQTEDDLLKSTVQFPVNSPDLSISECTSKSATPSNEDSASNDDCYDGAASSTRSSVQGSRAASPTDSMPTRRELGNNLPTLATRASSTSTMDDGDISDAESVASLDGLSDEQIASLMIDNELEEAAKNLHIKSRRLGTGQQHSRHRTTQTINAVGNIALSPLPEIRLSKQ